MRYGKDAGAVEVLRGVSIEVATGERVAIVGPSGCGKTTLLLLLAGLDRPSGGSVAIAGTPLETLNADHLADLRRDQLGIVFQAFHLVPSLSALENVALPLEIAGRAGARERARDLLDRVGLSARATHYPSQLSGGEQQRVALARAVVHAPAVLLADEPTGNLDDHTGALVADVLFTLTEESGASLILVTHDLTLAGRCDRVLRLNEGQLNDGPLVDAGPA